MGNEMRQIGEVAEDVGLSLRTIRHYEEVGLVPPSGGRSPGGFRLYTDQDVERLRLVKHMKPLEFTLEEMRTLLDARDRLAKGVDNATRATLIDQVAMFAAAADERCDRLQEQLEAAQNMAAMLHREAARGRRPERTRR